MPLIHRAARAVREVAPFMYVAAAVCFVIAALIAGPFHLIGTSLVLAERILLALGWAAWAGFLFVTAYLSEHYA